jgi:hypothetical protein
VQQRAQMRDQAETKCKQGIRTVWETEAEAGLYTERECSYMTSYLMAAGRQEQALHLGQSGTFGRFERIV